MPDDRLSPTEERLMDGLALEAGLVIKNRRLQRELGDRLAELRASRQRLVLVQDEERRRLERDLHDGAQQALVALRMKLGLAAAAARGEKSAVTPALDELQRELGAALDSLRSIARGFTRPYSRPRASGALSERGHVRCRCRSISTVTTGGIRARSRGPCTTAVRKPSRTSPSTPMPRASASGSGKSQEC